MSFVAKNFEPEVLHDLAARRSPTEPAKANAFKEAFMLLKEISRLNNNREHSLQRLHLSLVLMRLDAQSSEETASGSGRRMKGALVTLWLSGSQGLALVLSTHPIPPQS